MAVATTEKALSRTRESKAAEIKTVKGLLRLMTHGKILSGVSAAALKSAVDNAVLSAEEIHRFIPKSTFARKVRDGSLLSVEEADRLARLARLKAYAAEVFEDDEDVDTWLHETNPSLGGEVPLDLIVTDDGARKVETVLRRIDYGDHS